MRLIVQKGPSWSCQLCHNRSNASSSALCIICGAGRPQHRFALRLDEKYYLCKVKATLSGQYLSVFGVFTSSGGSFSIQLDENDELSVVNISTRVRDYLVQQSASIPDYDRGTSAEGDNFGIPDGKGAQESSGQAVSQRGSPVPLHARAGSFMNMFDPGRSLFETVMHNASTVTYNGKIGQFVSVETMQPDDTDGFETGGEGSSFRSSWSYVESMRKEQIVMRQVVQEVVRKRADDTYLYNSHADLDINRNEWDKEQECAMCERSYPQSQMPGQISFKAIADWKARHGAPLSPTDHRLDLIRLHDATRLCCFCTQFFDASAVDLVDRQALQKRVGLTELNLNGPLNCSNTVYKRMFRKAVAKVADVEDRPLSRMRHRVALEQLRFRAQFKNQSDARYIFNPKLPNLILDQEKVGSYLRNKYAGKSKVCPVNFIVFTAPLTVKDGIQAGTLLLAEKRSMKLKPLHGCTTGEEDNSSGAAFLTESGTGTSAQPTAGRGSTLASGGPDSTSLRSSLSQSASRANSRTDRHPIIGRGRATITGPASVHRARSESTITHNGGGGDDIGNRKKATALSLVNKTYQESLNSRVPASGDESPGKGDRKSVSFGEKPGAESESPVLKVRRKKRQSNTGTSKEARKPLILKVNAASVVGSQELGRVLEIELDSEKGKGLKGQREETLSPSAPPVRKHILSPLRGLLSNMQITKVGATAVRPAAAQSPDSPPSKPQTFIIVDRSPSHGQPDETFSPQSKDAQKALRVQSPGGSTLVGEKYDPPIARKGSPPINEQSPKGQALSTDHKKTTKRVTQPSKASKLPSKASTQGHSNNTAWKRNINKPVLRDVFESPPRGQNGGTKQDVPQDHSYITQVPENDQFIMDEAYMGGAAGTGSFADIEHDDGNIGSLSVEDHPSPASRLMARTSSFNGEALDDEYDDDDFEADGDGSPGELLDALYEGESMDRYNWVSAGPYQPPEDNGDLEGVGCSPVKLGAGLFGTSPERMRLLSRGSAGGLFSPVSRGLSSARRYSGQHTPLMLSSRGAGIAPVSPPAVALHEGTQSKLGRNIGNGGALPLHQRGSAKVPVVRRMEAVPVPHQHQHPQQLLGQRRVRKSKG